MRRLTKRLILFLLTGVLISGVVAQSLPNLHFHQYNISNGLSNNSVNAVFQDSRGFIYIGTDYGLNRFDGTEFIVYHYSPEDDRSLPSSRIKSITEDKNGLLWIGTSNGACTYDFSKNEFNRIERDTTISELKRNRDCRTIRDRLGNIWIAGIDYVGLFDERTQNMRWFAIDVGHSTQVIRNFYIFDILDKDDNHFWIATSYGVKLLDIETGKVISYHHPEARIRNAANAITSLAYNSEGVLIVTTWGEGVWYFDEKNKTFKPCTPLSILLTDPSSAIVMDILFLDGYCWMATNDGLFIVREKEMISEKQKIEMHRFKSKTGSLNSLNSSNLLSMHPDREGNIWISTSAGLCKVQTKGIVLKSLELNPDREGKPVRPTAIIEHQNANGSVLYVSGYDVYSFKKDGNIMASAGFDKTSVNGLRPVVWDMFKGKNNIWLATSRGLKELKNEKVVSLSEELNQQTSKYRYWKVFEDSKGIIWAGTIKNGILKIDIQNNQIDSFFTDNTKENSMSNRYPSSFYEDSGGNIWFGSNGRVYCYRYPEKTWKVFPMNDHSPHIIQPFYLDSTGAIWLVSQKEVFIMDTATGQKKETIFKHALLNNSSEALVDTFKNIWIANNAGLFQYDTQKKTLTDFTRRVSRTDSDISSIALGYDNTILVTTPGTIAILNPYQEVRKPDFPLQFTRVIINNKNILHSTGKMIKLPYQSSAAFNFSALSFNNENKITYRYMLEGADKNWNYLEDNNTVNFSLLQAGHYRFKVMAAFNGVWDATNQKIFEFSVLQPFYKSWWFLASVTLFLLTVFYAFYRFKLNQALAVEKIRTGIASDLHDDIGATLSGISMYSELLKNRIKEKAPDLEPILEKMGEESRIMVSNMSDIVWAINPENDSSQRLIERIESYALNFCSPQGVTITIKGKENWNHIELTLQQRKNIYLIFKEALNNALKYAKGKILIETEKYKDHLLLKIKDNGNGFDPSREYEGNGLRNMKIRAGEMKGDLKIISEKQSGTTVLLIVPIT